MSPEGTDILSVTVERRFPYDSKEEHEAHQAAGSSPVVHTVAEVIQVQTSSYTFRHRISQFRCLQEIMQKHVDGVHYREWNAGLQIDRNMQDQGMSFYYHELL